MTVQQAKGKWCRHGLLPAYSAANNASVSICPVNRSETAGNSMPKTRCLGNDCASWDWWDEENLGIERRGYCGADPIKPNRVGNRR